MSKIKKTTVFILLSIVILFGASSSLIASERDKLVTLEGEVNERWTEIENNFQSRQDLIADLIPNIEEMMIQEEEIIAEIIDAQRAISNEKDIEKIAQVNDQLDENLQTLSNIIRERYPQLISNDKVRDLLKQLEQSGNNIAVERQRYNDTVMEYNETVQKFPTVMIATVLGYETYDLFESAGHGLP